MMQPLFLFVCFSFQFIVLCGRSFPVRRKIDVPGAETSNNVNHSSQVRRYKIQGAESIYKILLQKEPKVSR